jgi:transketolase
MANGVMVSRALEAAETLALAGISARVLNVSTLRPMDRDAVLAAATETRGIVTVEEHSRHGGLGSAVAEISSTTHPAPMRILGVPDVFAPTGNASFLLEHFGLTASGIARAARELLESH